MTLADHGIESGEPSMLEQRLSIVHSVLRGDIEGALNELGEHSPDVPAQDGGMIRLQLRRRQFVELVNAAAEAIRALSSPAMLIASLSPSNASSTSASAAASLSAAESCRRALSTSSAASLSPGSETREQCAARKQVQAEMHARQQAAELARALERRQDIPHDIIMQTIRGRSPTGSYPDTSTDTSRHQMPAGSNTPTGTVEVPGRNRSGTIIARPIWDPTVLAPRWTHRPVTTPSQHGGQAPTSSPHNTMIAPKSSCNINSTRCASPAMTQATNDGDGGHRRRQQYSDDNNTAMIATVTERHPQPQWSDHVRDHSNLNARRRTAQVGFPFNGSHQARSGHSQAERGDYPRTYAEVSSLLTGIGTSVDRFLRECMAHGYVVTDPRWQIGGHGGITQAEVKVIGAVHVSARSWVPIIQLTRYTFYVVIPTLRGRHHGHRSLNTAARDFLLRGEGKSAIQYSCWDSWATEYDCARPPDWESAQGINNKKAGVACLLGRRSEDKDRYMKTMEKSPGSVGMRSIIVGGCKAVHLFGDGERAVQYCCAPSPGGEDPRRTKPARITGTHHTACRIQSTYLPRAPGNPGVVMRNGDYLDNVK
ncbi:hypothetical protein EDB85DRAFT_1894926 [Lactarius pseudohatsudake]|nr:hypothetical protein EDB85DRAFT_1894926 [Lactarius pseudohatsudake]